MHKWSGRENIGIHPIRIANSNNNNNGIDLWDNITCTNIHIIVVPEGEEGKKGSKYIWRNYGWKFHRLEGRNRYLGKGSTEGANKMNSKKSTLRCIIV